VEFVDVSDPWLDAEFLLILVGRVVVGEGKKGAGCDKPSRHMGVG
jgi:hypothetical protein